MTCVCWSAELQVPCQLCSYAFLRCMFIYHLPTARQSPAHRLPIACCLPADRLPTICSSQAKRLDELEKMYKEEQVGRKRLFNLMEDMKGKIRYATV